MKTNAVLLAVAFALVATAPPARADDPAPPADAQKVLTELEKDVKAIEAKVLKEVLERHEKAVKQLQQLQDTYAKASKKDDAAAVAGLIAQLKQEGIVLAAGGKVLADPGVLVGYRAKTDEVFYFKVVGSTDGEVWGTGVYTDDSPLATAAVHAGVLKKGETGIVKVTILAGEASYTGSTANEVTTSEYGQWEGSYKVEVLKAEKK
jgi:hypothetical protein